MININPRNGETIGNIIDSIFKLYQEYINEAQRKKIIDDTYDLFKMQVENNPITIEKMLMKIQEQRKFYYFDYFLHILIKQIYNQDIFVSKYYNLTKECFYPNYTKMLLINDKLQFNESNGIYKLYIDDSMNCYLLKKLNKRLSEQLQNREKQIMTKNLSKFLVTITDINEDSFLIPYFPMGTLNSIIKNKSSKEYKSQIEISIVDKIVIILEIAYAMNDLHFNGLIHGNLSSINIFISSSKDAYIGSILNDRYEEMMHGHPVPAIFTRSPEIFNELYFNNDNINNLDYKKYKSCDIFSFGVIIYEILTETTAASIFWGKYTRNSVFNIIKNHYSEFLFENESNQVFDDYLMLEYKYIIEKCMKNDINERYSSFNDIIKSIKRTSLYLENKEEIDFRINHAIDSADYECKFSDIVECHFRRNNDCTCDLFSFVKKLYVMFGCDPNLYFNNDCNIITAIFDALNTIEKSLL